MSAQLTEATATEEIAERYGEAWNSQNLDAILDLHTEDSVFQLHVPGSAAVAGKEAIRETFAAFLAQLPDINFATRRLQTGAEHWVLESTLSGTAAAAFELEDETIDSPGAAVEVDCVDVIQLRDGLVARKDTYLDAVSFQRQMGVE
jgi:steroid delta-isomerase-like uncharacterized protein